MCMIGIGPITLPSTPIGVAVQVSLTVRAMIDCTVPTGMTPLMRHRRGLDLGESFVIELTDCILF